MPNNFFNSFHIAGFSYYQGAKVFHELKIGTALTLKPEPGNIHDEFAVAIYFNDQKIGFVPRGKNSEISKLLQFGYEIFETVIQQVSPTEHPEGQVKVAVFLKEKDSLH